MAYYTEVLLYIVITPCILASIIGNIVILLVKFRRRKTKHFNSGDLFVVNLAICDLNKTWLVFFSWIYNSVIYKSWQFSDLACSILQKSTMILFTITSITLLVLTTERYFLVAKPFDRSFTFKRAQRLLLIMWLTIIAINSTPYFMSYRIYQHEGLSMCANRVGSNVVILVLEIIYFILAVFIPCTLIMVLSGLASKVLKSNSTTCIEPKMRYCPVFNKKMRRNRNAMYMLRSITLGYLFSYIPWAILCIIQAIEPRVFEEVFGNTIIEPLISWLIFGSLCNTPLTYVLFSLEFRKELKSIFTAKTSSESKIRIHPAN